MIAGLTQKEEKIVRSILSKYPDYSFFYYGSRVKGNFWKGSDLDVLIRGKTAIPPDTLEKLKDEFDNSDLSFIVNFVDFYDIDESFYQRIQKDLVPYIEEDK